MSLPALGGGAVGDPLHVVELDEFQRIEVAGDVPLVIGLIQDDVVAAHGMKDALPGDGLIGADEEGCGRFSRLRREA